MSDKVRGVTLTRKASFLGGERGSGLSICPSGEVLAWLAKRVFKCQFLYI